MRYKKANEFLSIIYDSSPRQRKSIESVIHEHFSDTEWKELEEIIDFYSLDYEMDFIAHSYLQVVEDTARETKYFLHTGRYRCSSFEEANRLVYSNNEYMSKYMIGLAISDYLWSNHIIISKWYQEILKTAPSVAYLEVGPGHGHYFKKALEFGNFTSMDAVDISETSVFQTRRFLEHHIPIDIIRKKEVNIYQEDCYKYSPRTPYGFIVIAEVLEHLEDPLSMLKRLYKFGADDANIYITVPVNAPAIDHIFLFDSIGMVEEMVGAAGFNIIDRIYAPAGGMDLQKAIKRKNAIIVGVYAKKG